MMLPFSLEDETLKKDCNNSDPPVRIHWILDMQITVK